MPICAASQPANSDPPPQVNAGHPLAAFELRASIDRIVIEVRLNQPTHFRHVRDRMKAAGLGAPLVHQIDPETIRATIQDPDTGPDAFMRVIQHLAPPGSGPIQESDITIVEVETTLDARPTAPATRDQLVGAVLHFVHHHANPPGNFRIVREKGHWRGNTAPLSQAPVRLALQAGDNTIGAGWYADTVKCETWGDPFRLRLYVKEYDSTPSDNYRALPTAQHSARIEAILSGRLCPFSTVTGWREFKFESLTPYFRQVRATPASQIAALGQGWVAALGLPTDTGKQAGHRRNSRVGTARDTALNRRIYKALARLTVRQFAEIRPPESSAQQAPPLGNSEVVVESPEYLIHQDPNKADSDPQHNPLDHATPPPKGGAAPTPEQTVTAPLRTAHNRPGSAASRHHQAHQAPARDLDTPAATASDPKPLIRVFS